MSNERIFPNEARAATEARHFTLGLLGDIDPAVAEDAAVMVSELATNSIRHAATQFTVAVDRADGHIRVAVSDIGPGVPEVQSPEPQQPTGRGLRIIQALADDWGVIAHSGSGKTVWFVIDKRRATRPEPEAATTDSTSNPSSTDGAASRRPSQRGPQSRAA